MSRDVIVRVIVRSNRSGIFRLCHFVGESNRSFGPSLYRRTTDHFLTCLF